LVEDNPGDARLIKEALSETEKIRTQIDHVDTLKALQERFSAEHFDLIILDLSLPWRR
jgi:CheY-like chemotaxis protein